MPVRKPHIKQNGYYFVTFTCHKWLPLFELVNAYDLVYKWFDYLQENGHKIVAYVIMPNHLHLILAYKHHDKSLNKVVGNGKRFLAYDIVKRLKEKESEDMLDLLQQGVNMSDWFRDKQHNVFEDSFDVKACYGTDFLMQKVNYIHNNPCSKDWRLVEDSTSYVHSSGSYYSTGVHLGYPISSWMELEAAGWWESASVL